MDYRLIAGFPRKTMSKWFWKDVSLQLLIPWGIGDWFQYKTPWQCHSHEAYYFFLADLEYVSRTISKKILIMIRRTIVIYVVIIKIKIMTIITGWWFGTFFYFPILGIIIIPIDFHIFHRGGWTTNQYNIAIADKVCGGLDRLLLDSCHQPLEKVTGRPDRISDGIETISIPFDTDEIRVPPKIWLIWATLKYYMGCK